MASRSPIPNCGNCAASRGCCGCRTVNHEGEDVPPSHAPPQASGDVVTRRRQRAG
jgi:hypothetical protein